MSSEASGARMADVDQPGIDAERRIPRPLRSLFAATREFYGAQTVGEALRLDLARIAELRGVHSALAATQIVSITQGESLRNVIAGRTAQFLTALTPARQRVLLGRIWADKRQTLESLGQELNVTRERVRQIEKRIVSDLEEDVGDEISIVASFIREQLSLVPREREVRRAIAEQSGNNEPTWTDLGVRRMLMAHLGYTFRHGLAFSKEALATVQQLKSDARTLADDVGLVHEQGLRKKLPGEDWEACFHDLIRGAGLCRLFGRLALRETRTASTKAALLSVGRPATKEEVAELLGLRAGRTGGLLSAIPSVGRVDSTRWWLKEEIEGEYKGIPEEIASRIRREGGATTVNELIDELPRRFGVNVQSVRAYIRTQQFVVQGGYVSLADPSALELPGRMGGR